MHRPALPPVACRSQVTITDGTSYRRYGPPSCGSTKTAITNTEVVGDHRDEITAASMPPLPPGERRPGDGRRRGRSRSPGRGRRGGDRVEPGSRPRPPRRTSSADQEISPRRRRSQQSAAPYTIRTATPATAAIVPARTITIASVTVQQLDQACRPRPPHDSRGKFDQARLPKTVTTMQRDARRHAVQPDARRPGESGEDRQVEAHVCDFSPSRRRALSTNTVAEACVRPGFPGRKDRPDPVQLQERGGSAPRSPRR